MGNDRIYIGINAASGQIIFDPNGEVINKHELVTIEAMIFWQAGRLGMFSYIMEGLLKEKFGVNDIKELKASAFNDVMEYLGNYKTEQ